MSAPTPIERDHYAKLMGRTIIGIQWEELEGRALPVLLFSDEGRDGQPAHAVVLADPEGNGPGHLDHKPVTANRNFVDSPGPRYREIVRRFEVRGYVQRVKDELA